MANYGPPGGPYPDPSQDPWPDRQSPDQYGQPADPWGGQEQRGDQDQWGGQDQWGNQEQWGGTPSSIPPGGPGSPVSHGGHRDPGTPGYPPPGPIPGYPEPGYQPTQHHEPGYGQVPHYQQNPQYQVGSPPTGPDPAWASPGADPAWSASGPEPLAKRGGNRIFVVALAALAVLVCGGGGIGLYLVGRDKPAPAAQSSTGPTGDPSKRPTASAEPAPTTAAPEASADARFVKAGQCVQNEGSDAKPRLAIIKCAPRTYQVVARINGSTTGEEDAKAKCSKVENYTNFYYFNSELDELDFVLCLRKR